MERCLRGCISYRWHGSLGGSHTSTTLLLLHGIVTRWEGLRGWAGGFLCTVHSHLQIGVWERTLWYSDSIPSKNVLSGNTICFAFQFFLLLESNPDGALLTIEYWINSTRAYVISFSTWNPRKKIHKTTAAWSIVDSVGKLSSSSGSSLSSNGGRREV